MQVNQEWDRPRLTSSEGLSAKSSASYYPPLRFPALADDGSSNGVRRWGDDSTRPTVSNGYAANGTPHAILPNKSVYDSGHHSFVETSGGASSSTNGLNGLGVNGGYSFSSTNGGQGNSLNTGLNGNHSSGFSTSMSFDGSRKESSGFDNASQSFSRPVMDTVSASPSAPPVSWPDGLGRPRAPASPQQRHRELPTASLPSLAPPSTDLEKVADCGGSDGPDVEVRGGGDIAPPWRTWDSVAFPPRIRSPLISAGFPSPTPIQQYAWPIIGSGRDLVGIAKTGSGKTLAFLLAPFAKLLETGADLRGPPAILVLAPTRELACQIEQEAKQFGAIAGMRAACLYGGAPKGPQLAELRQRPQVVVATPGRLNDLLDPAPGFTLAVDVKSVKYLVLDEADRMLDMGFEPQIRKIIAMLPKERQTSLFTATWPMAIRRLASEFQTDPAEVRVGDVEQLRVNPDIDQKFIICRDALEKEDRLAEVLREHGEDQAIIFVATKRMCEMISMRTQNSVSIHGDKDQQQRDAALAQFKAGTRRILVATDVAARGLDVKSVKLVVNFDPPNKDEDYVHRVGRTGRAGRKGSAVTLFTNEDGGVARAIVDMLKRDGLPVPEEIQKRLDSGEMRSGGGGRSSSRAPRDDFGGGRSSSRGPSRGFGGRDDFDDDDFGSRSMGGFGGGGGGGRGRSDDFRNSCSCPT